jgi:Tfp pilus assembly protein PilN
MIEINLLPGAGKKQSRRAGGGVSIASVASGVVAKVTDPFLVAAVLSVIVSAVAIGGAYWYQRAREVRLDAQLQTAEQDSIRYAAVIREKRRAESQRDSVVRQVELIRSFDNKRFVWPHIMDEVSRALPPYTWVTSLTQTNTQTVEPPPPPGAKSGKASEKPAGPPPVDSTSVPKVAFRLVGNTVDIQALTRFMKLLEASPFIENVQLEKSAIILVDGKEVTEFSLTGSYQSPDASVIKTVPVSLSVR